MSTSTKPKVCNSLMPWACNAMVMKLMTVMSYSSGHSTGVKRWSSCFKTLSIMKADGLVDLWLEQTRFWSTHGRFFFFSLVEFSALHLFTCQWINALYCPYCNWDTSLALAGLAGVMHSIYMYVMFMTKMRIAFHNDSESAHDLSISVHQVEWLSDWVISAQQN